jgi:2-polyprenyl-3-methyl-5-hydroxy-6-metoxy-1,4-benzoquinol methylase
VTGRPRLRQLAVTVRARRRPATAPRGGFPPTQVPSPELDALSDADLDHLNGLLPWQCFTTDGRGRRFGDIAWSGKRSEPQLLPDPRIVRLDGVVPLAGRHVLEIGCFEGVHTTALSQRAGRVTAIDSRIENVVKTTVRCAMYGERPTVLVRDMESEPEDSALYACDVLHHVGVLYHLADPVTHLRAALAQTRVGVLLDTHFTAAADETYQTRHGTHPFARYGEHGRADGFSGMQSFARWLPLDEIRSCLLDTGFEIVAEDVREERNGPRVLFIGRRRDGAQD